MTKPEFTPAPWKRDELIIKGESDELIAVIMFPRLQHENVEFELAEANARLIASAPDLYRILEGFLEVYENNKGYELMKLYREKAHDVLAKARGEL